MILFLIFGLLVLILLIATINSSFQFKKQVKKLFAESKNISAQTFHKSQLVNLPGPVQRYFNHVLKEGQPYISCARIKHDGQFKTGIDKDWINIQGEQYATTGTPGFIWKGTTKMFTARDMYIAGKGRLVVLLLSLFPVVDAKGGQYNQGELLRWLGESILYPTNFLPGERLQWFSINPQAAKLTFNYNGLSLFFIVTINETGEITRMETKRYMNKKDVKPWVIKMTNYKKLNDVIIPIAFEVLWQLGNKDFSYAKFNITQVEYNNPEKF